MIYRRLSSGEKRLLFFTALVLSLFVFCTLILEPAAKRYGQVNQEIALREASLRRALLMADQESGLQNRYEKYADYIEMTGSENEEMSKVLKDIESLSADVLSFSTVRPRSISDVDFYKKFAVEADCETDIKALIQFIHRLENSGKMFKITSLRLSAKEGEPNALRASMLISKILIPQQQ